MNRKGLLYILILMFHVFSEAKAQEQVPSRQNFVDSLSQKIEMMKDDDSNKIYLLNEYARYHFYDQNLTEAFSAVRTAKRLTDELEFEDGNIMYYLTLSVFHGATDMAAYYQKKADWLSERTDKEPPNYEIYISPDLGAFKWTREIVDHFNSLLHQFNEDDVKELRANIFLFIATGQFELSNTDESLNSLAKAITLFKEIEDLYPVVLISRYQILLLNSQDKEDEAKEIEHALVDLVTKSKNHNRLYFITSAMGDNYASAGRYALAIEYYLKSLEEAERVGDMELVANIQLDLGTSYESLELNNKAVEHYMKGIETIEELGDSLLWKYANGVIVFPLIALGEYEQAQKYMRLAADDTLDYSLTNNTKHFLLARYFDAQGQLLMKQGQYAESIQYFQKAYSIFQDIDGFNWALPFMKLYLAECYFKTGQYQEAIENGLACFDLTDQTRVTAKASLLLSEIYAEISNLPLAYKYSKMYIAIKAEVEKLDERNRIADAEIRSILDKSQTQIQNLEKERLLNEQESKMQKIWIFSIAGALISAIILALVLFQNNKNKQTANTLLTQQKQEIESTLARLKSTQSQLIQSEKMASLGELTAGIAHEIQNPLNFVNNFSEINTELIHEIQEERQKNKTRQDEELQNVLLKDVAENQNKINHHGKRASEIVKSMLEHSRQGDGQKELTDLNKLADEYLRLAYHGIRAKDKKFNVDFKLDLDESLPKVNVVHQDIGRVLLNLINNAFYACNEQRERANADRSGSTYQPLVTVSTKSYGDKIQITVSDNGPGIPEQIHGKIFQPFFTTKATGDGTGLGLSLSYDIIKAHGGMLALESDPGKGAAFKIELPYI